MPNPTCLDCGKPVSRNDVTRCRPCATFYKRRGATVRPTCTTEWCDNVSRTWKPGPCGPCYDRSRQNNGADPALVLPKRRPYRHWTIEEVAARALAIEPGPGGCRDGSTIFATTSGYAVSGADKGHHLVTRLVLATHLGRSLQPGMFACHVCDNPPCVEPTHLFEGSHEDNMADMRSKGRGNVGSRNGIAKLTEDDVREIRRRYVRGADRTQRGNAAELAAEFEVSRECISALVRGKTWRHVI